MDPQPWRRWRPGLCTNSASFALTAAACALQDCAAHQTIRYARPAAPDTRYARPAGEAALTAADREALRRAAALLSGGTMLEGSSRTIQLPPLAPSTAPSLSGCSISSGSIGADESLPRYGRPMAARLAATSPFAPPPLARLVPGQDLEVPLRAPSPPPGTDTWRPEVRTQM